MKKLQKEIGEWSCKTFPKSTLKSCIKHLQEEVDELQTHHDECDEIDPLEIADILILAFGIAHRAKINSKKAILKKMEINKQRDWSTRNLERFDD